MLLLVLVLAGFLIYEGSNYHDSVSESITTTICTTTSLLGTFNYLTDRPLGVALGACATIGRY